MDKFVNENRIINLWASLQSCITENHKSDWEVMSLDKNTSKYFKLGIKVLEKQEALIVGFKDIQLDRLKNLPNANGFHVEKISNYDLDDESTWIALYRDESANLEIFSRMAADILETCERKETLSEKAIYAAFINRIIQWQHFMKRCSSGLSREEIIGLSGELEVLTFIIDYFKEKKDIEPIDYWQGPFDGLHDFKFDYGDIEIKSTIKSADLFVNIHSDQLELSNSNSLFLITCVFNKSDKGERLLDRINRIRFLLENRVDSLKKFENALFNLGVQEQTLNDSVGYELCEFVIHEVTPDFPCLRTSMLPQVISNVTYKLNISKIDVHYASLTDVLLKVTDNK